MGAGLVRKAPKAADAAGLSLGGCRGAARSVAMETGWGQAAGCSAQSRPYFLTRTAVVPA